MCEYRAYPYGRRPDLDTGDRQRIARVANGTLYVRFGTSDSEPFVSARWYADLLVNSLQDALLYFGEDRLARECDYHLCNEGVASLASRLVALGSILRDETRRDLPFDERQILAACLNCEVSPPRHRQGGAYERYFHAERIARSGIWYRNVALLGMSIRVKG